MNANDLRSVAEGAIDSSSPVIAAGVFGLQDNYAAIAAGGAITAIAAPDLGPTGDAAVGAATVHATREAVARSDGVTVRMLVAVTEDSIHVLALGAVGNHPGRELIRFERAATEVEVRKFGLSRHLDLRDSSGRQLGLTGSTAPFSSASSGDRAVLDALGR